MQIISHENDKSLLISTFFTTFAAERIYFRLNINHLSNKTMKKILFPLILLTCSLSACDNGFKIESGFTAVPLESQITAVQPMTGLVMWTTHSARQRYADAITLEYQYCLPCRVVTGKVDGKIQYDWSYFEQILDDIKSRNHQGVIRFRYEYPNNTMVDGVAGSTAVPQYIKDLEDYNETFNKNAGGDGPTYYADWTNEELKWFTKQFYIDFAERYNNDPRIAFLELGFGHWSEYHIYGTRLNLGVNFPSHEYQKEFLTHVSEVLDIPWAISIDAADQSYTPIVGDESLMSLQFGLFDDSFMHAHHEIKQGDGYNERCWNEIGRGTRWHTGVCGGEISYYTSADQRNFLSPEGLYGWTWEAASAKYNITFMIANDATGSIHGSVERFREAGMAVGYNFQVTNCRTNGEETRLVVTNTGIAPIYRDAYFQIGEARSSASLIGLLPGTSLDITIPAGLTNASELTITSPHILPTQKIEFEASVAPVE